MCDTLEFSPFYPCLQGVLEHVAIKQCAFCIHADIKREECDLDCIYAKAKSPHKCAHFKKNKEAPPYIMIRITPPCTICGEDCFTDNVPRINNVSINGDKLSPVCDKCISIFKYIIKDRRQVITDYMAKEVKSVICMDSPDIHGSVKK